MTNVIYVGTDRGIHRSDDSGATWAAVNEGLPPNADVQTILVEPQAPENIFVGTNGNGVLHGVDQLQIVLPVDLLVGGGVLILTLLTVGLIAIGWSRRFSRAAQERAGASEWA